jgi:hypothetical protein
MILTKGFHKHHIKPRYAGGDDSPENLVLLHPIDHAIAHLVQYKMFGNIRDKWASNWLQGIVDPDVYTKFSIEREKSIKEKRAKNSNFDEHMRKVRSNATKNRKEGYQAKAGKEFKERMKTDFLWANKISEQRKKAKIESVKAKYLKDESRVVMVRQMRKNGCKYEEIKKATGFFISVISGILNGTKYIGVGELSNA